MNVNESESSPAMKRIPPVAAAWVDVGAARERLLSAMIRNWGAQQVSFYARMLVGSARHAAKMERLYGSGQIAALRAQLDVYERGAGHQTVSQ